MFFPPQKFCVVYFTFYLLSDEGIKLNLIYILINEN